jgi:hypothetical protein
LSQVDVEEFSHSSHLEDLTSKLLLIQKINNKKMVILKLYRPQRVELLQIGLLLMGLMKLN